MASGLRLLGKCLSILPQKTMYATSYNRGVKRWVAPTLRVLKKKQEKLEVKPSHRNTYAEWNYNAEVFAYGKRLGEEFDDRLLRRALTQRSYIVMEEEKQKAVGIEEPKLALQDNSEFSEQGENLMKHYIQRYLRTALPRLPEEGICALVNYLMSEETLSDICFHMGTSELILCSDFPVEKSTLVNVLKAVVFALAQSSGEERATLFIRDFIITYLSGKDVNAIWEISNPEQVLSKILQREGKSQAEPRIIGEAGRNTILANYQVGLYCDKQLIGIGFGETIDTAKEMAARDALKRLFKTTDRDKPIPFDLKLSPTSNHPFANLSIEDWCEKNLKTLVEKK